MKILLNSLLIISVFGASCSGPTKLTSSLRLEGQESVSYEKLGVVVMSPRISRRAIVEQDIALRLSENGTKSIPTYNIFPFAADQEIRQQQQKENQRSPEEQREYIKQRVEAAGLDAIMVVALFDEKKEERYVSGGGVSVGIVAPGYYDPMYPTYGYSYYGYYSHAYSTMYSPGYYETTKVFFLEINLYDVESGHLIWTGTTETNEPSNIETESKLFARIIVDELYSKNVLKQ